MVYFDKEFIQFFKELEENNNREWFHSNKKRYEQHVKNRFSDFVHDLIFRLNQLDNDIQLETKDAIFRINRDIRFSKDKTPYNTLVKAGFSKGGRKSPYAGFYFGLSADKLNIGGGVYMLDKDNLDKIRELIAKQPDRFLDIINEASFKKAFGELQGDKNKRIPSEYKETANHVPWIANKQFYYMTDFNAIDTIFRNDLLEFVVKLYSIGLPLNRFLKLAIV